MLLRTLNELTKGQASLEELLAFNRRIRDELIAYGEQQRLAEYFGLTVEHESQDRVCQQN